MRSKLIKILLLFILFFAIFIAYKLFNDWKNNFEGKIGVGEGKQTIYTKIRHIIPKPLMSILRNTIFLGPTINKKLSKFESDIKVLKKEIDNLSVNTISSLITTDYFPITMQKKTLPFIGYNKHGKSFAYIDIHKDKIFIVTGIGQVFFLESKNLLELDESNIFPIENNLKNVISGKHFWKIDKSSQYSEEMSVKDILIHNEKIYLSYSKEVTKECFNTSILHADLNLDYLNFEDFFTYEDCQSGIGQVSVFGRGGGGRIYPYKKDKLLYSIGDTGSLRSQEDDFMLGKIVEIDIKTKKHSIISKGHRNPQGLIYLSKLDTIIASEHGSKDGGEINIIKKNKNYGWPISSYGKGPQLYTNHAEHGFEEPLHYFIPSVAPSELIKVPESFSNQWKDNLLLTTLAGTWGYGKSIYRFEMSEDYKEINKIEQIKIGDRIRDIKFEPISNTFILTLENSNSLGIISKN